MSATIIDDYSGIQLECHSLSNYIQAARRHCESVVILQSADDTSMVIYSTELLLYTCFEMGLKFIYVLCRLESEWQSLPTDQTALHKFIGEILKQHDHSLDRTFDAACTFNDLLVIDDLQRFSFNYCNTQPAGNFYEVSYDSEKFALNNTFSTRYPAYSKPDGTDVSIISGYNTSQKVTAAKTLLDISDRLFNRFVAKAYPERQNL